jgi:flagellar basal body-associated protein FliL
MPMDELNDNLEAEEPKAEKKKGKGIPMIAIFGAVAVAAIAIGFFAGKMMAPKAEKQKLPVEEKTEQTKEEDLQKLPDDSETSGADTKKQVKQDKKKGDEAVISPGMLALETFTINLNDPFGRRYAEIQMNLRLKQKEFLVLITENELIIPQIRDEIFMIISGKSYMDLKSTSGKITLKEEIMMRVNEIVKEELGFEPVNNVFFIKFLVQ